MVIEGLHASKHKPMRHISGRGELSMRMTLA